VTSGRRVILVSPKAVVVINHGVRRQNDRRRSLNVVVVVSPPRSARGRLTGRAGRAGFGVRRV